MTLSRTTIGGVSRGADQHGGDPARPRSAEERSRLFVVAIAGAAGGNEDAGVEEYRGAVHGLSRPYTTSSTVALSSGWPSRSPTYAIHGLSLGSRDTASRKPRRHSSARQADREPVAVIESARRRVVDGPCTAKRELCRIAREGILRDGDGFGYSCLSCWRGRCRPGTSAHGKRFEARRRNAGCRSAPGPLFLPTLPILVETWKCASGTSQLFKLRWSGSPGSGFLAAAAERHTSRKEGRTQMKALVWFWAVLGISLCTAAGAGAQTPASAGATPADAGGVEVVFWQTIRNSTNPAEFEAYLEQFPNGVFRALAQARLATLSTPAASGTSPSSGPPLRPHRRDANRHWRG